MGKCVVKECDANSQRDNKAHGITFHSVPKDPVRRKKWMKIIRLLRKETDWIPTRSAKICSKHFRDEDKIPNKSNDARVYLTNEAVPMVVEEPCLEALVSAKNMEIDEQVESDEEIDEITESPRQHKMRKTIDRLKFISAARFKKIKILSQQNRGLEKKNKKLREVIEELKKINNVELR